MRSTRAALAALEDGDAAYYEALLTEAGYGVVARARDVPGAIDAIRRTEPDLLLADAILPGGDGESLARAILHGALNRYPSILVIYGGAFRLPGDERLEGLGAQRLAKPVTPATLREAVARLEADPGALPGDIAEKLDRLLRRLGVPPHSGREMLARAAALAWRDRRRLHNLRDDIYPEVAKPFGKTAAQAERAIRHVIEAAWRNGDMEEQQRIFGNTIDAKRGRPTCGEMIAQLADILRWEG